VAPWVASTSGYDGGVTTPADSSLNLDELVSASGERVVLEAFLDLYRGIVVQKVAGLSAEAVHRRLVPSATTLAGIVSHLASVEREWFHAILAQRPPAEAGVRIADDGWRVPSEQSTDELVADYQRACASSRQLAASFSLDDSVPHPRLGRVSLRWIYVHMIEETARHAGHADILREQTDGATGFDG
jgi:uncharacterized damage-inducible protein DinB